MESYTYSERDTPNEREYVLQGIRLTISGRKGNFGRFSADFYLTDVAPHFVQVTLFHPGLKRSAIYLGCVASAAWIAYQMAAPSYWIAVSGGVLVLPGLFALNQTWRPFEVAQFRTRAGIVLFDIIREKSKGAECDAFIDRLHAAVLSAHAKEGPNKSPEPTPTAVTPRANEGKSK